MKEQRIQEIEKYLLQYGTASLDALCSFFNVSKNTIRRDIAELDAKGVIKKVYGGIVLNGRARENTIPFNQREIKNMEAKRRIGLLAREHIHDGDIIFLDSGTTTLQLVPHITGKSITLITNNLNAINGCLNHPNINVIATGGKLYPKTNSFIGEQAKKSLKQFNIAKAFMAATGISIERGCTNSSSLETEIKQTVIERSESIYVLADHTKYDVVSLMTYSRLEDIDFFVTDRQPPERFAAFFKRNGVEAVF